MYDPPRDPLAELSIPAEIALLPKADLHVHQEWSPRLDRVLARRDDRSAFDWNAWARRLMGGTAAGMPRLAQLSRVFPAERELDSPPENFIARIEELLEEGATDGAILVEARFGNETVLRPDFVDLFREAERRVQGRHPAFHAEAIVTLLLWQDPEELGRVVDLCARRGAAGIAGVDLLYAPYDTEADWALAYRLAARAADAGLGVTAHAGEFSAANIAAALAVPGLTRLGHAVHAARNPRLLERVAAAGVTVEVALSSNAILGAVLTLEDHPIRRFSEGGIPVVLGTDDPVQLCTTIGREYALAATLGFTPADLARFTTNAIAAAFTTPTRRRAMLAAMRRDEGVSPPGVVGAHVG